MHIIYLCTYVQSQPSRWLLAVLLPSLASKTKKRWQHADPNSK